MTGNTRQRGGRPARAGPKGPAPWILVTNDDGIDSPALPPLLEALGGLAPVCAIVPSREYSWSSKTMSRFGRLELRRCTADLYALDGSPADCASIGVHNLRPEPPRLVVSGVNIGINAGLAFLLSSGTVGAALEASLSGVPAVAFSAQLQPEEYDRWRARRDLATLAQTWTRAADIALDISGEILARGLPSGAQLVSVNLPPGADRQTPRVLTGVTETSYGAFFRLAGDGRYEHEYSGLRRTQASGGGDLEALDGGRVAITPLRFQLDVPPAALDRARFERGG